MTKDEALAAWDEATTRLAEVKARHKRELSLAKREFATARDAFIDASALLNSRATVAPPKAWADAKAEIDSGWPEKETP